MRDTDYTWRPRTPASGLFACSVAVPHRIAVCVSVQLLPEEVPGKAGGSPGNAFELVYGHVTDAVRRTVRKSDPVLAEWIR